MVGALMYKFLMLLMVFLFVSSVVRAEVTDEIHQKCKDVTDYVGCIKIFTGQTGPEAKKDTYADKLKEALRLLTGRISNTSLASFSDSIQPFTDAFSLASSDPDLLNSELVKGAESIQKALDGTRVIWSHSIHAKVHLMNNKNCRELNGMLENINRSVGWMAVSYESTAWFCATEVRKEYELINNIKSMSMSLANGSGLGLEPFVSVSQIKERNDRRKILTKEIKTLQKTYDSLMKKLVRAEKKIAKKPSDKTKALVQELSEQTEIAKTDLEKLKQELSYWTQM